MSKNIRYSGEDGIEKSVPGDHHFSSLVKLMIDSYIAIVDLAKETGR